jgi:hypothetical protein
MSAVGQIKCVILLHLEPSEKMRSPNTYIRIHNYRDKYIRHARQRNDGWSDTSQSVGKYKRRYCERFRVRDILTARVILGNLTDPLCLHSSMTPHCGSTGRLFTDNGSMRAQLKPPLSSIGSNPNPNPDCVFLDLLIRILALQTWAAFYSLSLFR